MMRVALSGGIASGKTTVSDAFATHGVPIIDADILAREVVAPGTDGLKQIVDRFGENMLNYTGALDRKKLREMVFSDDTARDDLEAIVHPLIRDLTQTRLKQHEAEGALYCIVVIPLLVETNQQGNYDYVIIVDVEPKVQIQRIMDRDHCSPEHAKDIIATQATRKERLAIADDLIINSHTKLAIDLQVKKMHAHLLSLARRMKKDKENNA